MELVRPAEAMCIPHDCRGFELGSDIAGIFGSSDMLAEAADQAMAGSLADTEVAVAKFDSLFSPAPLEKAWLPKIHHTPTESAQDHKSARHSNYYADYTLSHTSIPGHRLGSHLHVYYVPAA